MPWCEECSKYLTPSTVKGDGTCPTCGRPVREIERRPDDELERRPDDETDQSSMPWHFKLLVLALVVYLGWRFVQLIGWIV